MSNDNHAVARRFMSALAKGDVDQLQSMLHPDFVAPAAFTAPGIDGIEAMTGAVRMLHEAYSDFSIEIHDVIGERDEVAVRDTITATHTGTMFGVPATGKKFTIDEQVWLSFRDGQVIRVWPQADNLSMLYQVGALPA